MTPRTALDVLQQAAAKFMGTLEDHNTLQEAVKVLDSLVAKGETSPEKPSPEPKK